MTLDEFIEQEELIIKVFDEQAEKLRAKTPGYDQLKANHEDLLALLKYLKVLHEKCKQKCSSCKHNEKEEHEYPCNACKFAYPSKYQPEGDDEE